MSRLGQLITTTTTALLLALNGEKMVLADDPIRFLYPDKRGLEFHYLDRIDVSYESNFSAPYLYIWCGNGNARQKQTDRPNGGNATTEITLKFERDQDLVNDCWFNLRPYDLSSSTPLGVNSLGFTYLHASRQGGPATLGLPSATAATSISTPTASGVTNGTDSAAPSTTTVAQASSGLSTGAVAGIGVGVGVGAIAIAAAVGAFFFRLRKRARTEKDGMGRTDTRDVGGRTPSPGFYSASELQGHEHASEMAAYKGKYAPVAPGSPQEMPADHNPTDHNALAMERHELPAGLDGRDEGRLRP
ncbi:hypothetical protein DHEL01_v200218 [Diaporthe helianthi]|uniref:Uncharacterized protein n=1 Tax=Diaporthe helianthi TaxID=158607 RepID=A0A2P5IFW8_DIAHE|nr:hypothetical protein DHEL01_v200218 [Diaporthe helianthi]